MAGTAIMAGTQAENRTITMLQGPERKTTDDRRSSGLWALVAGDHQLGGLHLLRLQLLQAADQARLALLRRLQRLPRRAVHRDVRFSVDDLSPLRMAAEPLSRRRLAVA